MAAACRRHPLPSDRGMAVAQRDAARLPMLWVAGRYGDGAARLATPPLSDRSAGFPRMRPADQMKVRQAFGTDDDSQPVMVPRSDKALVAVLPERVRRLREHMIKTLRELRAAKN